MSIHARRKSIGHGVEIGHIRRGMTGEEMSSDCRAVESRPSSKPAGNPKRPAKSSTSRKQYLRVAAILDDFARQVQFTAKPVDRYRQGVTIERFGVVAELEPMGSPRFRVDFKA